MITNLLVSDDDPSAPIDHRSAIDLSIRALHYKVVDPTALDGLNWKLNKIQEVWGDYATVMGLMRTVQPSIDALLDFRAKVEVLRKTWQTIQTHKAAGQILFADAIAKTGRHRVLFDLDAVLTSPELQETLSGLTAHQLRRRLAPASGPLPIDPIVLDLVRLLRRLESCLEPIPQIKRVRTVASLATRCDIASRLLKIIQINFSAQTIRNATMERLP